MPTAFHRVLYDKIDLGTIERAVAFTDLIGNTPLLQRRGQRSLSPLPGLQGTQVLIRSCREKDLQVIGRVKELLYDEGYTIAGAKKKLEGELAAGGFQAATALPAASTTEKQASPKPAGGDRGSTKPEKPDHSAAEEIKNLRQGAQEALDQAREILSLLDSNSKSK